MSNPEATGNPEDPTIRPIENLLASMGGEHVGAAALSGAAEQNELPPLLLPSTLNDIKWESQHGGEVSVINCANETSPGGVIKVYRSASCEAGYVLKPRVGPDIQISAKDIVQIYPRDKHGDLPEHPTFIFQGVTNVPKGFALTYDDIPVPSREEEIKNWEKQGDTTVIITGNLEDPEHIMGERREADNRKLRFLSSLFTEGIISPDYPLDEDTTLVWYPLNGKPLNVVTPAGDLIKGHRNDIIEVVRTYPDASRSPLRRVTLGKLSEEEGYMVMPEVYRGR